MSYASNSPALPHSKGNMTLVLKVGKSGRPNCYHGVVRVKLAAENVNKTGGKYG
jgi:hypothetical protein